MEAWTPWAATRVHPTFLIKLSEACSARGDSSRLRSRRGIDRLDFLTEKHRRKLPTRWLISRASVCFRSRKKKRVVSVAFEILARSCHMLEWVWSSRGRYVLLQQAYIRRRLWRIFSIDAVSSIKFRYAIDGFWRPLIRVSWKVLCILQNACFWVIGVFFLKKFGYFKKHRESSRYFRLTRLSR